MINIINGDACAKKHGLMTSTCDRHADIINGESKIIETAGSLFMENVHVIIEAIVLAIKKV